MCIFDDIVEEVSNTRIFVALTKDGRQITVYQNTVISKQDNAMILPVPMQTNISIQLLDLSTDKDFFANLNALYPIETFDKSSDYWGTNDDESSDPDDLYEVHQVGSYRVSIVWNINGFSRLDTNEFSVNPKVLTSLSTHYANGFAFLVCRFSPRSSQNQSKTVDNPEEMEMHPLGYIHDLIPEKNKSNLYGQYCLWVPTLHIHDGQEHEIEEFDHDIYSLCTKDGQVPTKFKIKPGEIAGLFRSTSFDRYLTNRIDLHRLQIKGPAKNRDQILAIKK